MVLGWVGEAILEGGGWFVGVDLEDVEGEFAVVDFVGQVQHDVDQIETRQQGRSQVDVLYHRLLSVVFGPDGVGCR